ncbi:MAG: hypothetical protein ACOY3K_04515 [Candidatus Omnitrophota bacterium]
MFKTILKELRAHAPFTALGTLAGIVFLVLFTRLPKELSFRLFYFFHPTHVFFSALVTSSMFHLHSRSAGRACGLGTLLAIGYLGSVGIGTVSDSLIPYLGERLLGLPHAHAHIGFIEEWWLVNPLAFLGILLAHRAPFTKLPHAVHILLSTWASIFHMLMAMGDGFAWPAVATLAVFLFIAVWVPCCTSDIVFPLLFFGKAPSCDCHRSHS